MAEVLGIAASIAGLASLSVQAAEAVTKSKARTVAVEELPRKIQGISEDLQALEEARKILEKTSGDDEIHLEDYKAIQDALSSLDAEVASRGSKSRIRSLLKSKTTLLHKFDEIDRLTNRAQSRFTITTMSMIAARVETMTQLLKALPTPVDLPSEISEVVHPDSNAEAAVSSAEFAFRPPRLSDCSVRHCYCSCHATRSNAWRFWGMKYTPLRAIFRACDQEICSARRYQLAIRIQFSRLGIPVAMLIGGQIVTGTAGYSLRPTFQISHVVKATSLGFEILRRLEEEDIDVHEAKKRLGHLYRSDPSARFHINPNGRTHIQELIYSGPWGEYGWRVSDQIRILDHFVADLGATSGMNTAEFLYDVAGWKAEGAHVALARSLVGNKQTFQEVDEPLFSFWPDPEWTREAPMEMHGEPPVKATDPFYLDFLRNVTKLNEGFGGSHPLHCAILHGNTVAAKAWAEKIQKSRDSLPVNFLGQAPLHMALRSEDQTILEILVNKFASHIDNTDNWGFTPLMYAVAMGYRESASFLIRHGANLSVRVRLPGLSDPGQECDFIGCASIWGRADIVWDLLQDAIHAGHDVAQQFWRGLAETLDRILYSIDQNDKIWVKRFWDFLSSSGPRDVNFTFGDGKTLAHLLQLAETVEPLIQKGFSALNQRDGSGEHCLFNAVRYHHILATLLTNGAEPSIANRKGETAYHRLFSLKLFKRLVPQSRQAAALIPHVIFRSLRLLLQHDVVGGTRPIPSDNCGCPCTENGHLPLDHLNPRFQDTFVSPETNPLWALEAISVFEDHGRVEWARRSIISFIRRSEFSKLGMKHTDCCCLEKFPSTEEERFWDTSSIIRREQLIEQLEQKMATYASQALDLPALKGMLVLIMNDSYQETLSKRAEEAQQKREKLEDLWSASEAPVTETEVPKLIVDYENDTYQTRFDIFLSNMKNNMIHFDWDFGEISEIKVDPAECMEEYEKYMVANLKDGHRPTGEPIAWLKLRCRWMVLLNAIMGLRTIYTNHRDRRERESSSQE